MSLRAIVFDRDGVLTRFEFAPLMRLFAGIPAASPQALWTLWQDYLAAWPPPRTAEGQAQHIAAFWERVVETWDLDESTAARLSAFDYRRTFVAFEDARSALQEARARGLRVGVLSNFPFIGLDASLQAAGLRDLVDVTVAAGVLGTPKPRPEAYRSALRALGVEADECVLIDDEEPCVRGARDVGMRAYHLQRGGIETGDDVVTSLTTLGSILDRVDLELRGSGSERP